MIKFVYVFFGFFFILGLVIIWKAPFDILGYFLSVVFGMALLSFAESVNITKNKI